MRTVGATLCTLLLSCLCVPRSGATVYHSNGSVANVQALHNAALDGDTITLPAGTFSWTSRLSITKGITLKGKTTVKGAGTSRPRVVDSTIIKDQLPRTSTTGMIKVGSAVDKKVRITGITFARGSSTSTPGGHGFIALSGSGGNMNIRLDHCHFAKLYEQNLIWVSGWVYGVADHNVIEVIGNSFPFNIWENAYFGRTFGDGAWADYPWYGTGKFFFIEDNTVVRTGSRMANSLADATQGARYVIRRNYVVNCIPSNHGTEHRWRGSRAYEVYDNTFNITVPWSGGGQRSGTSLWHDNVFRGVEPSNGSLCNLAVFRQFRPTLGFGQAVGNNIWDANDTEGNGTFVEGHAPHLFESGTATTSAAGGKLIDSTKNWVPNQWAGYSVKNTNINVGANIISNTSNTIRYQYYTDNTGKFKPLIFNAGHKYQIHKVLIALDQNGRGKGDLLSGNPAINTTTGAPNWPHQALEPCYSWNNAYAANGHELGLHPAASGQTTTKPGVDYFNLGGGFPANSPPSAVSSTYTAALNGVDYTGTYIYPHPLTLLPGGTPRAVVSDFDGDSSPDYALRRAGTEQTGIYYLDNNVYAGSASGPTLSPGWDVVAAADFNGDGHSDYLLYNASTHQTGIYYLDNNVLAGSAWGPTLPPSWDVVAAADFNGDGHSDYLLYNASTHQTGIYYLDNNVYVGSAWGPTLPPVFTLVGAADFNRDAKPDYLLYDVNTEQTGIYYLDNNVYIGSAWGPTLPPVFTLVGAADFNRDAKPDYLLYDVNTQQTGIYYLDNNVNAGSAWGPTTSPGWSLFGGE